MFATWFKSKWQKANEAESRAVYRFCARAGLSNMTVLRAIAGKPVSGTSAIAIAKATRGAVKVEKLVRAQVSEAPAGLRRARTRAA